MRYFLLSLFLLFSVSCWAVSDSQIAKLVENAPEVKSESELSNLVKKLTQGLKKEEDKAYSLLTWIVKNIDYDDYKMNQIDKKMESQYARAEIPESGDILKTRLGVCEDIANLYKKMLEQAEMKAVVIAGCAGEVDKKKGGCKDGSAGHTWNAVWIDKQWELVDPTWAITGKQTNAMSDVTRKRKYERELKKRERKSAHTYKPREGRSVNKKWFMVSPSTMEADHQPNDKKWLLTKTKDRRNKDL